MFSCDNSWSDRSGSNRRKPPRPKRGALPTELRSDEMVGHLGNAPSQSKTLVLQTSPRLQWDTDPNIQQAENIRITESDTSINPKYLLLKEVSDSIITLC